jgi:hypothetical protein
LLLAFPLSSLHVSLFDNSNNIWQRVWIFSSVESCAGWLKSHETHINIFIDGCDSVQFSWISNTRYHSDNTKAHVGHIILWLFHWLFSNYWSVRVSLSQV